MQNKFPFDEIIINPNDIDLDYSPIKKNLKTNTFVLGAFNPGMSRLPNGNIIIMVRIAEALKNPVFNSKIHSIRWDTEKGYVFDGYDIDDVDTDDPRKFALKKYYPTQVYALTSISWILPIELSPDGREIVEIYYDKIISPAKSYQEYGIEDARISLIEGKYYLTACSVSSERHSTTLYSSENGLDYTLEGIVLDHQNKDMLLFEGKIKEKYYALTRPLGSIYFATPPNSGYSPGPGINLAQSPDLLHWKPLDVPFIRIKSSFGKTIKLGGGAQPIRTDKGWLVLFHGVQEHGEVGIYNTYYALLDINNPSVILKSDVQKPVLTSLPKLTESLKDQFYLENVVFTTGIIDNGDNFIVASGENDLCCRITHIPKSYFNL